MRIRHIIDHSPHYPQLPFDDGKAALAIVLTIVFSVVVSFSVLVWLTVRVWSG